MSYDSDNDREPDFDLILGAWLKCPKGRWLLDDVDIKTGPDGAVPLLLLSTWRHGVIRFDKGDDGIVRAVIVGELKAYSDCAPSHDKMPEGCNPYTIGHVLIDGELATFTASSWGARKQFKQVFDNHRIVHPREFPVCALGATIPDQNGNSAPTFTPVKWVPIGDFADMLGGTEAIEASPAPKPLPPVAEAPPPIDEASVNWADVTGEDSGPF